MRNLFDMIIIHFVHMIVYSGCLLFTFFSSFWNKWSFIYLFLLKKFNSPSSICTTGDWTAFLKVDMSLTHVLSFQPFSLICKIMYVIHLQADAKDALLATGLCPILILLWLFSCSRCVIFLFKRWKKNWQCVKSDLKNCLSFLLWIYDVQRLTRSI